MARSLNKVTLIGNLTRDPELRYTPQGNAVCTFSVATNRQWTTDTGEKKEDAEFHRIVAWNKLAEICAQFLSKGRKTYVEGRLQTRDWKTQEGDDRTTTEIVANEMIILDSRGAPTTVDTGSGLDIPESAIDDIDLDEGSSAKSKAAAKKTTTGKKTSTKKTTSKKSSDDNEDIPF